MSFNSEQLRVLVERVDSILATRRGLLPAVQREVDDAARRKSDVERLLSLLAELKEIEKDLDARQRIDGAIDDLNRLLDSFAAREETLDALRVRFSRGTVNIGVSGEARVGKSTTLQKFSGLTDTQIPTGRGLPVTAVRSEIFNCADDRAEVTFRDQKTFITEYVQPLLEIVNKHLDVPLSVDSLAGLRTAKFPETLGTNVDSVSTDSLSRLLDAQRCLSTYESLLTGSMKQVALGDLRSYVAYPTKDDLDAEKSTGMPPNRSYIAVKAVKIYCPFPRLEGLKIGLVDLPGLGEIGESVADMHLDGLEDGVDQIFPIMRPTDAEGYAKQGIASNIDHLRRIQPGIRRRGDLITAGINVTEGLSETVETLKDDFERKINSASSDRIEVLEYTAIDNTSVADLFDSLLKRVSDRLPTMDQEVLAYALASEAGEADVAGTLAELNRTLTGLLRLIPIPAAVLLKQISRIASGLIHGYNIFQKKLDDEADEHSDWYVAFDADVERIHAQSIALVQDGFFMGQGEWESAARGQKDYYNWYRNEAQRLRREIIAQYSGLDVFYDDQVTQFKNDIIRIFFDNTGDLDTKLQGIPDDDPDVVIDRLAVEFGGTVQDGDLDSALALLKDVKFSFRNNVFLQISRHLKELANPRESFLLNPGAKNPQWENIREVLGVVGNYEHQLGRLRDYLTRIATEANDAIRGSLLEHDDRFHEYLSVSIAFFNDFLYRKDEENFKHVVISSLIKEYRDYILGEDTGVAIDSKKKDLIDRIKAAVQEVGASQSSSQRRRSRRSRRSHARRPRRQCPSRWSRPSPTPRCQTRQPPAFRMSRGPLRSPEARTEGAPKTNGRKENGVMLLDPKEYLSGHRRIVVDTSSLLESREGYSGGILQLIMNCSDELARNPLVIPKAVINELANQTSGWRTRRDPELAGRATLAKALVDDLVADGFATASFGGNKDVDADSEFNTIARVATEMGWEVLLLTADITVKLEVRLLGKLNGAAHTAGVPTTDGLIEVEDPAFLLKKGADKLKSLADKTGKADEYNRLSAVLRVWPQAFALNLQPKNVARPTKAPTRRNEEPSAPFAKSERLKPLDRALEVKSFPGDGETTYFSRPGAEGQLVLGERISRGKEGSVYAIEDEPSLLAKIFKRGKVTTHRKEKVELMVHHRVWLPGVCFPESVLRYDDEFVGFTMRRAQDANVLNETIFIPQELERLYPGWTRRDLVDVCLSFLERVRSLHELNIIIGDINPNNVMLGKQKDAWIIDIDSVQVEGYPCPVGWDEFTAPEILGGVQGLRSMEHEYFAVAVMLFMIMMTGTFPYENSGSDDTIQNIKSGLFPYGFGGKSERDLQPPLRWLYVWSHLSHQLKDLFWNSFHREGSRYQPGQRVTVEEWINAFEGFKKILGYRDVDPQSLEIFPIRRKAERGAQLVDCRACGGERFIAQYRLSDAEEWVTPSLCNECLPHCQSCGEPREPDALEDDVCWPCRRPGVEAAARLKREEDRVKREAERAQREAQKAKKDAERARRESLDPTRLCERCGRPYITLGEIDWLTQRSIPIRPVHKHSDPACVTSPQASRTANGPTSGSTLKPRTTTAKPQTPAPRAESLWTSITRWFKNL